jgi:hypothetical protein
MKNPLHKWKFGENSPVKETLGLPGLTRIHVLPSLQQPFLVSIFRQKKKFQFKDSKMKQFWKFSIARSQRKKTKNHQICIHGFFQCVAKNIEE